MTEPRPFVAMDRLQQWYADLIANHYEEALQQVEEILDATEEDENGCRITPTAAPRKLRFRGEQDRAYRFAYCILNSLAATRDQVIRHRCHNRCCVNPAHLTIGDRRDNLEDEWDRQANGVDFRFL